MTKTRFKAEWVSGNAGNEYEPEWVYGSAVCPTFTAADHTARLEAERAGVAPDWWRVEEQLWDPDYYEPGVGEWETITVWTEGVEHA